MSTAEKWAFSIDNGETWDGAWDRESTIAEGMTVARNGDHSTFKLAPVCYANAEDLRPGASELIELAREYARDNIWADSEVDFPDGADDALDVLLKHTWGAWVELYGVTCNAFTVATARVEIIDVTPSDAWEHGEPQP